MEVPLRSIGNSWGVIIPKPFLEQLEITGAVEMTIVERTLVLAPKRKVREGWGDGPPLELTAEDAAWISGLEDAELDDEWSW